MDELLALLREVERLVAEGATGSTLSNAVFDRDYTAYKIQTFLTSAGELSQTESDLLDQASDVVDAIPSEEFGDIADAVEDTLNNLNDNAPEYEAYRQRLSVAPAATATGGGRRPPPPESSGSRPIPAAATAPPVTQPTPPVTQPTPPVAQPAPRVVPQPVVTPVVTPPVVTPPVAPPVQPASVLTPPVAQATPTPPPVARPVSSTLDNLRAEIEASRAAQEAADIELDRVQAEGQARGTVARDVEQGRASEARRVANPNAAQEAAEGQVRSGENRFQARNRRLDERRVRQRGIAQATEARIAARTARLAAETARVAGIEQGRVVGNASRTARGQERLAARTAAETEAAAAARATVEENRPALEARRVANQAVLAERARRAALTPQELRAEEAAVRSAARFEREKNTLPDGDPKKIGRVTQSTYESRKRIAARAEQAARTAATAQATTAAAEAAQVAAAAVEAARPPPPVSRGRRFANSLRNVIPVPGTGPISARTSANAQRVGTAIGRAPGVGRVANAIVNSPARRGVASAIGTVANSLPGKIATRAITPALLAYDIISQGGVTFDDTLSSEHRLPYAVDFGGTVIPADQNVVAIDPRSEGLFAVLTGALEYVELENKPRAFDDYVLLRGDPAQLGQLIDYFPQKELEATLIAGQLTKQGQILFVEQDIPDGEGGETTQLTNTFSQLGEGDGLLGYLGGSSFIQQTAFDLARVSPNVRALFNGTILSTEELEAYQLQLDQEDYKAEIARTDAEFLGVQNGLPASQNPNNPIALPDFTQQTTPLPQPPPSVTGIPEIDQALANGTTGDPQLDQAIAQVLQGPQGNPAGPQPIQRQGPTGSPAPQGGAQLQQGPTGVPELDQALAQLQGSEAGSTGIPELDQAITQLQNSEAGVTGIPELDQALAGGQQTPQQSSQVPQQQVQQGQQAPQGQNEQLVNRILEQFPGLQTPQLQDAGGGIQTLIDTLSQPIEVGAFDQRGGFQGPPDLTPEAADAFRLQSRLGTVLESANPDLTDAQSIIGTLSALLQDPVAARQAEIAEEQRAFGNERRTAELTEYARVQGLGLEANANRERSLGQAVDSQSRAIGTRNTNEISRVRDLNTNTSGIFFGGGELLQRAIDSDATALSRGRTFEQTQRNDDRRFIQGAEELELRRDELRSASEDRRLTREAKRLVDEARIEFQNGTLSIDRYNARVQAIINRPTAP